MGWVLAHSGRKGMPTLIPIPGATTSARIQENMKPAELSEDELASIAEFLKKFTPVGTRYPAALMALSEQ
jgi:pyridoxine 4-dehydrogenase